MWLKYANYNVELASMSSFRSVVKFNRLPSGIVYAA